MDATILPQANAWAAVWASWMAGELLAALGVLAVVLLLWGLIRRKASPQLGYLLFLLVPLKLLLPLPLAVPERFLAWWPASPAVPAASVPAPSPQPTATSPSPQALPANTSDVRPVGSPAAPHVEPRPSLSWPLGLMLLWALGVLGLSVRLIWSQLRLFRWARHATPLDPARLGLAWDQLQARMGVARPVRLVESSQLPAPAVCGLWRPMLILPTGLASSLSPPQLEWVLLHELGHVRRRDLAVHALQRLVSIVHFLNPAIWLANHWINHLREYACDDLATTLGRGEPCNPGEAFLEVLRFASARRLASNPALAGSLSLFESAAQTACQRRMTRLLDTDRRMTARLSLGSLVFLVLIAALALPRLQAADEPPQAANGNNVNTAAAVEKEPVAPSDDEVFHFSVVIARHVLLLEGKEIVTWEDIEKKIAARPRPSQTHPHFYFTHGSMESGLYDSIKRDSRMMRLHHDYKLVGHSEGSLLPRASWRYDQIRTADDLKPDESLRVEGTLVSVDGKPVAGADVVLITPVDASIPYKDYDITLVRGRIHQPLEEILTHSDEQGRFALYPPRNASYAILALHPEVGIGLADHPQLVKEGQVRLLAWGGLETKFAPAPEPQEAQLSTRIPAREERPEISLSIQNLSGSKPPEPTLQFHFAHVPAIFETTIYRAFADPENHTTYNIPGASVSLLPGETRRIDLGPVTEQQRKFMEEMRHR